MLFYYWGLFTDAKLFTLAYIVPLLQDVNVVFNPSDCTSTVQAIVTDIPLSERYSLGADQLSLPLKTR